MATPLRCVYNFWESVKSYDFSLIQPHKRTALEEAAYANQTEIVNLLLEAGANPNEPLNNTPPYKILSSNVKLKNISTQVKTGNISKSLQYCG